MPSVAAHLAPGIAEDVLGLPSAKRYVVLLVDGLGWDALFDPATEAPALRGMTSSRLVCGLPSTTAASLPALTTGEPALRHGVVGFSFRTRPGFIMNTMAWDDACSSPEDVQRMPTWFERLATAGVPCAAVAPGIFAGSGLTRAYLRGAGFVGVPDEKNWSARAGQVADVAGTHQLTYVYERGLDHVAHLRGWRSNAWQKKLTAIDRFVGVLRDVLPTGTGLLVTGDHGVVDVPKTHRLLIEHEPELADGVDMAGGEARLCHLYTDQPEAVARRWREFLGSRAEVRLRADALDWFGDGTPDESVSQRLGDVVVAMLDDWAVLTTRRPAEVSLVGMHGSLTPAERGVPLLKEVV